MGTDSRVVVPEAVGRMGRECFMGQRLFGKIDSLVTLAVPAGALTASPRTLLRGQHDGPQGPCSFNTHVEGHSRPGTALGEGTRNKTDPSWAPRAAIGVAVPPAQPGAHRQGLGQPGDRPTLMTGILREPRAHPGVAEPRARPPSPPGPSLLSSGTLAAISDTTLYPGAVPGLGVDGLLRGQEGP